MMNASSTPASIFFDNPGLLDIYHDDIHLHCVGSGAGASNIQELQHFFFATHFHLEFPQLQIAHQISHRDSQGFAINESVYSFHIKGSFPNAFQWLIPGVQLSNPNATVSISLTIVTIVEYSHDLINNIRIYWDQGCLLKQLGVLHHIEPKLNTFVSNQAPILGSSQASRSVDFDNLNPWKTVASMSQHLQEQPPQSTKQKRLGNAQVLQESDHTPPRHVRQLKESPLKSSDHMKEYFNGESTTDWMPRTKLIRTPSSSKSSVFDDVEIKKFSHLAINPHKNKSQMDHTVVQRGQGNTSTIFNNSEEQHQPLPHVSGIKRQTTKSQIIFGNEDEAPTNQMPKTFRSSRGNVSHFDIADSGRMDPKQPYHGRKKVILLMINVVY